MTAHVAILRIAVPLLGDVLRLPAGNAVIGARVAVSSDQIELLISGEDMPESDLKGTPIVSLLMQVEYRDQPTGRETRLMASWAHAPERRWVMRDWSAEPL